MAMDTRRVHLEAASMAIEWSNISSGAYRCVSDLGTGNGDSLQNTLKLLTGVQSVFAFDNVSSIVEQAKKRHPDPRIQYIVADVGDPSMVKSDWRGSSDLVTGFFCLHWIQDQKVALRNIASLLREGGEFLLLLAMKTAGGWAEVNRQSKEDPRWKDYLKDFSMPRIFTPGWERNNILEYPDMSEAYVQFASEGGLEVTGEKEVSFERILGDEKDCKDHLRPFRTDLDYIPEDESEDFLDFAAKVYREHSPRDANGATLWRSNLCFMKGRKSGHKEAGEP